MNWIESGFWIGLLASTIRLSTPLTLAALGGLFSERSGVINIGLEGLMLVGAFAAAAGNLATGSPWLGLLIALGSCALLAGVHALASIHWRANQVVSGMAINILALGLTPMLSKAFYGSTGSTPSISPDAHFSDWSVPFLSKIPVLSALFTDHTPIVFFALMLVPIIHYWFYRTAGGLRVRAIGEHPAAADSVGLSIPKIRYLCVIASGALCGLAGAFLSIGYGSHFSRNMTAGRGFIALTALIFGKWKPVPTFLACLLFGLMDALQIRLQGVSVPILGEIAPQFIQSLPYVTTLIVLGGFVGSARSPKALGFPYIKED
ncbi:MAG: ABC transporter permease [Pseudomonadota bacterium]